MKEMNSSERRRRDEEENRKVKEAQKRAVAAQEEEELEEELEQEQEELEEEELEEELEEKELESSSEPPSSTTELEEEEEESLSEFQKEPPINNELNSDYGVIASRIDIGEALLNARDANIEASIKELGLEGKLDGKTKALLRELIIKKDEAVEEEDFDAAKKWKMSIEKMKEVAIELSELEEKKDEAVKAEDFDTAKKFKIEIEKLRQEVVDISDGKTNENSNSNEKEKDKEKIIEKDKERKINEYEDDFEDEDEEEDDEIEEEIEKEKEKEKSNENSRPNSEKGKEVENETKLPPDDDENLIKDDKIKEKEKEELEDTKNDVEEPAPRKSENKSGMTEEEMEAFGLLPKGSSLLRKGKNGNLDFGEFGKKDENSKMKENNENLDENEDDEEDSEEELKEQELKNEKPKQAANQKVEPKPQSKSKESEQKPSNAKKGSEEQEEQQELADGEFQIIGEYNGPSYGNDEDVAVAEEDAKIAAEEFEREMKAKAIRQDDAEPLTEREQLDFSSAVESVGERIVARLRSNVWSHREQGLKDLESLSKGLNEDGEEVDNSNQDMESTARVMQSWLIRLAQDKNMEVYVACLDTVCALAESVSGEREKKQICEPYLKYVIPRMAEAAKKVSERSQSFVLFCADTSLGGIGPENVASELIPPHTTTINSSSSVGTLTPVNSGQSGEGTNQEGNERDGKDIGSGGGTLSGINKPILLSNFKQHFERMNILKKLADTNGASSICGSNITGVGESKKTLTENVLRYVTTQLISPNDKVRDLSVELFVMLHSTVGSKVAMAALEKTNKNVEIPSAVMKRVCDAVNETAIPPEPSASSIGEESSAPSGKGKQESSNAAKGAGKVEGKAKAAQPDQKGAQGANAKEEEEPEPKQGQPKANTKPPQGKEEAKQEPPTPSKEEEEIVNNNNEDDEDDWTYCEFCGEEDNEWQKADVELHEREACPMLIRCEECQLVVRIDELIVHRLSNCSTKAYGECRRCHEAILLTQLDSHEKAAKCTPAKANSNEARCPLCHTDIQADDKGWLLHLTKQPGCAGNPRTKAKWRKDAEKETVEANVAKPTTASAAAKPAASKIPRLSKK